MIKLNKLLTEIKVNKPVAAIDKKTLLDWWFKEGNIYLLSYLTHHSSIDDLIFEEGYDNLEEYLIDNFGFQDEAMNLYKNYINNYYRMFKPKEIRVDVFGDKYGIDIKGTPYKNIEIGYIGDGYYYIYCDNY